MSDKSRFAVEMWPIERPVDYSKNARKWSKHAIEKVATSIREFGWRQPVVVDSEGVIVIGHLRRTAGLSIGLTECPVHVARDLSPAKIRALRLADNRTAQEADWDLDILAAEFADLKTFDFDLSITGFDSRELDALMLKPNANEDDIPPVPDVPITKPGDLWMLGAHRILCGDSTDPASVARLMGGEKAVLFATDPPYLVDYQGGNHPQSWTNSPETRDAHWDDYIDPDNAVAFYEAFLKIGLQNCIERVPVYQWHADLRRIVVAESWKRAGLLLHQIIVWVKARPVLTRSHFMWQHEPCAYGWTKGSMPVKPPCNEHSVWTINQVGESDGIHPTQKPCELFRKPLIFHTKPGELAYEPFSGSGTMIAAAELTGRRCNAMEISPAFVDVAITRWENLTGKKAVLESHA